MTAALSWLQAGILTPAGASEAAGWLEADREKGRGHLDSESVDKVSVSCAWCQVSRPAEERADVNIDIWDNVCPERGGGQQLNILIT